MKFNTFFTILCCVFIAATSFAQKAETTTKNEVVVQDGRIIIRSVNVTKAPATKKTVSQQIEVIKRKEAEIEAKVKQAAESIAELEKLIAQVRSKEEGLKGTDAPKEKSTVPIKESETKNKVVQKNGKVFVETTTINQVETSSATIEKSIEGLKKNETELKNQLKSVENGKKELISILFEIEAIKK